MSLETLIITLGNPCKNFYNIEKNFDDNREAYPEVDRDPGQVDQIISNKNKKRKGETLASNSKTTKTNQETETVKMKQDVSKYEKDLQTEGTTSFSLSSLETHNWLNDEVINEYLKLLSTVDSNVFVFTTYFHTAFREGGFKKVKSYYRRYDLLEYNKIIIPVHQTNH